MGPITQEITRRLTEAFAPLALQVSDDSARHHGHAGHRPGMETHFTVTLTAAAFAGKGRVERQRMVYAVLADLMDNPIHALALTVNAPA